MEPQENTELQEYAASLTDEEWEQIHRIWINDFQAWIEAVGHIADERGVTTLIKLSESQLLMLRVFMALWRLGIPVRIINLKARQVYASTLWTLLSVWLYYFADGPRRTLLIGDEQKRADQLARMVSICLDNLPEPLKIKHKIRKLERLDVKAMYDVTTAKNLRPGQGATAQFTVATEGPYYPQADKKFLALTEASPKLPYNVFIIEGTANGFDEYFQPTWEDAMRTAMEQAALHGCKDHYELLLEKGIWRSGDWFPLFVAWWQMKKYVYPAAEEGVTEDNLTEYEKEIKKRFNLTLDQLAWRRNKIRTDMKGDADKFKQEYPATPDEAFLASGRPFFNVEAFAPRIIVTQKQDEKLHHAKIEWYHALRGDYRPKYDTYGNIVNRDKLRVRVFKHSNGPIRLWKTPKGEYGNRYCIGADNGRHLEQNDFCAAYVKDRVTQEYVAQIHGHFTEYEFAEMLVQLAIYYNNAWLQIERNDNGIAVVKKAAEFYTRLMGDIRYIHGKEELQEGNVGYFLTKESRAYGLNLVYQYISEKSHNMPFYRWYHEALTFVYNAAGKPQAMGKDTNPGSKCYDDCIMASLHTELCDENAPPPYKYKDTTREEAEEVHHIIGV